jgi:hypothetical protein
MARPNLNCRLNTEVLLSDALTSLIDVLRGTLKR